MSKRRKSATATLAKVDRGLSRSLTSVLASTQSDAPRRYGTTPEEIAEMMRDEGARDDVTGAYVTAANSMRVAAVYACVALLSRSQGMLPLQLYKRDGRSRTLDTEHPVSDLLMVAPNRWQTPMEFEAMLIAHRAIVGNAYAHIVRQGSKPIELVPLNPANMQVVQRPDGALEYLYTRQDGKRIRFSQSEIHHRRGLSTDGIVGLSPVAAARKAIGLAMQTERHAGALFKQGAKPAGALKTANALTDEAYTRLQQSFSADYEGVENHYKTLILEQGLEWQSISMNAVDSQFLESRKFQRSEIAMFYGVPPHMIGDIERGTSWGSGIEQQSLGFLTHTLQPYLVADQQALARDLLTPAERKTHIIRHDTAALTQIAFLPRQQGYEIQLRNGVINPNEWRIREGENPRDDAEGNLYQNPGSAARAGKGEAGSADSGSGDDAPEGDEGADTAAA